MTVFRPEWLLRIVCAVIVGSFIGYERFSQSKEAGVRTHAVVALASCLLMIISQYGFSDMTRFDSARIAAQVVSGVGFLGAGLIFVQRGMIQGLSTAAGMWATSAIGMAIGAGMYVIAIFSGVLVYIIQSTVQKMMPYYTPKNLMRVIITLKNDASLESVNKTLSEMGYAHSENFIYSGDDDKLFVETEIVTHKNNCPKSIVDKLSACEGVIDARIK